MVYGILLVAVVMETSAAPVVLNAGFEASMHADGVFSAGSVPSWNINVSSGSAGDFNPTSAGFTLHEPLSAPADGTHVSFSDGGTLCQDVVGGTIQVGNTYTLTVAVGSRKDFPIPAGGYTIEIRATTLNTLKASSSTPTPMIDTFATSTAAFTAVSDADTGSALTVCLFSAAQQTDFDTVALTPVELQSFSIE